MVKRSEAPRQWGKRSNYLFLCEGCHTRVHRDNTTLICQLAHKLIEDPEYFCLRSINNISCQSEVQLPEVVKYVRIFYNF